MEEGTMSEKRKNGWSLERENGKMFYRPFDEGEEFRRSERGFGKCSEQ